MLGSLAEGVSHISGFLEGEDALATLEAFRAMGVWIEGPEQGRVTVHGVGMTGLKAPLAPLYLGNSGEDDQDPYGGSRSENARYGGFGGDRQTQ